MIRASRNFYGTLKVFDYSPDVPDDHYRLLMHGATTHGLQFVKPEKALLATSYYGEHSGIGLAFLHLPRTSGRHFGLVGLGTGTVAVYGQADDTLRIYEINPAVEKLAHDPFTHIDRSPAKVSVVMGDARLSLEQELAAGQPNEFDLLALDAFSSDAIPAHLLTKEAFEVYLKHLRPDGVIAVHISNRHLDLRPVVKRQANRLGWAAVIINDDREDEDLLYSSDWVLITSDLGALSLEPIEHASSHEFGAVERIELWTDDRTALWRILRF